MMNNADASLTSAWHIKGGRQIVPAPFLVAGIVNVTPDSFSDGGRYTMTENAISHIKNMIAAGADIVDIGGESTRPGAENIGASLEICRLKPVLEQLEYCTDSAHVPFFSVDTYRAATAAHVLDYDHISIINDISGAVLDPAMVEVVTTYKPGYVLGHCPVLPQIMQQAPRYQDVVEEILHYFTQQMNILVKAGLPENRIVLDPCVGFSKKLEHNLAVIHGVDRFTSLGRPLYYGISRKSLFRDLCSASVDERDTLTQVLVALLATKGVAIHRVHDVPATRKTLKIVEAVKLYP